MSNIFQASITFQTKFLEASEIQLAVNESEIQLAVNESEIQSAVKESEIQSVVNKSEIHSPHFDFSNIKSYH